MTTNQGWTNKRVLVTVRTYPSPARKGIEVSCTAGITDEGRWIRLFPIPYRFLGSDKRFAKYQSIQASVAKSESDPRPESYKVDIDSIKILSEAISTKDKWDARKAKVMPLRARSLCFLQSERDRNKEPTLGFFRPKTISGLKIEPASSEWTEEELARLRQYQLFGNAPTTQLEKLPFTFSYEFRCDEGGCGGHRLSCTDWEMGAAFRGFRAKYGSKWEQKFRDRFETEMILVKDTHFFVGTVHAHPDAWIIIGLFYPPK